jgi:signal transduction histidine kinase
MSSGLGDLRKDYESVLRAYVEAGGEAERARAYDIGRAAEARGHGALAVATFHHEALHHLCAGNTTPLAEMLRAANDILLDALSPFELAYRDAIEANTLRRMNLRSEEEMRRIAHALHDETGQLLALIHLALAEQEAELPPTMRGSSNRMRALLDRFEAELRRLSHELRPTILDDLGLAPAVDLLVKGISNRSGLSIELVGSTGGRLSSAVEIALYRIIQEALTNVSRHARARQVCVELQRTPAAIRCAVVDDGCGFDSEPGGCARGLGLLGIQERVDALGGRLNIESTRGRGTRLVVNIPLGGERGD